MAFSLQPLPYAAAALEPHMSARTLEFHHGKHHKKYVDETNRLIAGTPFERQSLEEIVRATADDRRKENAKLFNNAAQVWNHNLFWNSMKPHGGGKPDETISRALAKTFGGLDGFNKAFKAAGAGQFGSGYAWLMLGSDGLEVAATGNAYPPFVDGKLPLLCCDVWEHAYYLDYQNMRDGFLDVFLEHLINWDLAAQRAAHRKDLLAEVS